MGGVKNLTSPQNFNVDTLLLELLHFIIIIIIIIIIKQIFVKP